MRPAVVIRLVAIVAFGAAAVVAARSGAGDVLTDGDRARELLRDSGWLGPLGFVGAFAVAHPVGIPSAAFVLASAVVWPIPTAMGLSWLGSMAGAMLSFGFARWVAGDWLNARIPERFRRFERRLADRAVVSVAAVRMFTFLSPPADWLFAACRVPTSHFLLGTALGVVPAIIFLVVVGDAFTRAPALAAALVGAGAVAGGAVWFVRRRRRRRSLAAEVQDLPRPAVP